MQPDAPYRPLIPCLESLEARWRSVIFKLETMKASVTSGGQEWLHEATEECEEAQRQLVREHRTFLAALSQTAVTLGLSPESTLRELAAAASEPWDYILGEHRRELLAMAERTNDLQRQNIDLFTRLRNRANSTLSLLGAQTSVAYSQTGDIGSARGSIGLVDARA